MSLITFEAKFSFMNKLIGRKKELETLKSLLNSNKSEFIAVYGRRRVGKTFLIRSAFNQ